MSDMLFSIVKENSVKKKFKEEIIALANNGFGHEGLYALLKAAQSSIELQSKLLEELVKRVKESEEVSAEEYLPTLINEQVEELPTEISVQLPKLRQYSTQGIELWRSMFAQKAQELAERDAATFIVGHAMFMSLIEFIESHSKARKSLHILIPDLIVDTEQKVSGYVIHEGNLSQLSKDFDRPRNAVVVDDVRSTGETEKLLLDFWNQTRHDQIPTFEYISKLEENNQNT